MVKKCVRFEKMAKIKFWSYFFEMTSLDYENLTPYVKLGKEYHRISKNVIWAIFVAPVGYSVIFKMCQPQMC